MLEDVTGDEDNDDNDGGEDEVESSEGTGKDEGKGKGEGEGEGEEGEVEDGEVILVIVIVLFFFFLAVVVKVVMVVVTDVSPSDVLSCLPFELLFVNASVLTKVSLDAAADAVALGVLCFASGRPFDSLGEDEAAADAEAEAEAAEMGMASNPGMGPLIPGMFRWSKLSSTWWPMSS